MVTPLSAPWLLRTSQVEGEARLLLRITGGSGPQRLASPGQAGCDLDPGRLGVPPAELWLEWRCAVDRPAASDRLARAERCAARVSARLRTTPLAPDVFVASFPVVLWGARGGCYRIGCGRRQTPWMAVPPDPPLDRCWRFLLLSDHQQKPGVAATLAAVRRRDRRQPFHGILFAGDLASIPDDLASWVGRPDGLSFFDTLAGPADELFTAEDLQREEPPAAATVGLRRGPLLGTTPIVTCAGNHEVSSTLGESPRDRFLAVSPDDWNLDTYRRLFVPAGCADGAVARRSDPEGLVLAQALGPLRILSLCVTRRWAPGDHETRSGPCYELPGRFIFEPIVPGSPQYDWLRREIAADLGRDPEPTPSIATARSGGAAGGSSAGRVPAPCVRVALLHHPPFAQGHNALPLFGEPVDYRRNLIADHLVPLLEPWANLVLSGHNHAVNHHEVAGVHYFESSHMGAGYPPVRRRPDGGVAPEPLGHPARLYISEEGATFFSTLEVRGDALCAGARICGGSARVRTFRVHPRGTSEEEYAFDL